MICTERYVEKANAGLGGVGYEKMIVTADLLRQIGSNRVIPIVRQRSTVHLPTFLGSKMYIDLLTEDQFETGMDQLLRDLLNAPLFIKPPIGSALFEPVRGTPRPSNPPPVLQFMQALAKVYERSSDAGALRTEWVRPEMKTTKLFFDHAFDQAVALKYVDCSPDKQIIWVQNAGRDFLINEASKDPSAASYIAALRATGGFIRDGQDLNYNNFCGVDLPLIPSTEQAMTGRFLDWANGRIGRAIRAKRKEISLLIEQKQATINRAVTFGIDHKVPLKSSGVYWLGDIPQHWEVISRRMRYSVEPWAKLWGRAPRRQQPMMPTSAMPKTW